MRQCEQIITKLCIPACPCQGGNSSREPEQQTGRDCSPVLPGHSAAWQVPPAAKKGGWEGYLRTWARGEVCRRVFSRCVSRSELGAGVVRALVSACKGAGKKWSSFTASKAQLSHNESLFTGGREMCDMVLLSFLKIKAGRKRGFMQKDLSRLLPPPPSPSRKPDSPWEIIWQVQW